MYFISARTESETSVFCAIEASSHRRIECLDFTRQNRDLIESCRSGGDSGLILTTTWGALMCPQCAGVNVATLLESLNGYEHNFQARDVLCIGMNKTCERRWTVGAMRSRMRMVARGCRTCLHCDSRFRPGMEDMRSFCCTRRPRAVVHSVPRELSCARATNFREKERRISRCLNAFAVWVRAECAGAVCTI